MHADTPPSSSSTLTSKAPAADIEVKEGKTSLPISSSTATLVAVENDENDVSNLNNSNSLKVVRKQSSMLVAVASSAKALNKDSESKKREDLTSLGSDDSGKRENFAVFYFIYNIFYFKI